MEVVEVGGKSFHSDCFTCDRCNKSLSGLKVYYHQGESLCEQDYEDATSFQCVVCQGKILASQKTCLSVGEDKYHEECFSCKVLPK